MMLLLRELMVVVYVRVPSTLNATLCLRSFVGAPLHMHKKKRVAVITIIIIKNKLKKKRVREET